MGKDSTMFSSMESLLSDLFTPHCYEEIFLKQHFFDVACDKIILSKLLGYAILLGSLMVKVPQIGKIYLNRSGRGVSVLAESIMLAAIFGSMAYGYTSSFPLSAYGDSFFLFIQTILIILLVLYYQRKFVLALVYLLLCLGSTVLMYRKMIPVGLVDILAGLSLVLSLVSRLWQAVCIYRAGSTGNLSALTMLMLFFGSMARIFTSIEETGDPTLIWTYILNTLANCILVLQLGYYWSAPALPPHADEDEQEQPQKTKKTQ